MIFEYGVSFFQSEELPRYAKKFLKVLPVDVSDLLVRGSSGVAIGASMLTLSSRPLHITYVRKENEHSHGTTYSGNLSTGNYAIVDDFISAGGTVKFLLEWARKKEIRVTTIIVLTNNHVNFPVPVIEVG